MDLISNENKGLKEQITLTKNNIIPSKQDDVLTYFRGKGLELNDENLAKMLESHPEWLPNKTPTTTIIEMGAEGTSQSKHFGRRRSVEDVRLGQIRKIKENQK